MRLQLENPVQGIVAFMHMTSVDMARHDIHKWKDCPYRSVASRRPVLSILRLETPPRLGISRSIVTE